jgi:hypothetical protein
MKMGVFVVDKGGNGANTLAAGKQEYIDIFLKGCKQAVEVSKRCGGKLATVVPGDFARNLPLRYTKRERNNRVAQRRRNFRAPRHCYGA